MYSVWIVQTGGKPDVCFIADVPTYALAEKISQRLAAVFGAATARIEKD